MRRKLTYQACLDFLFGLEKSGIKLGLERTQNLLNAIGSPHRAFKSIHIAGTNGKGSVASIIHSVLVASGIRTGLFTSPHLVCFRERIRSNGYCISREELCEIVNDIKGAIIASGASFFEACTAIAFEYFKRKSIEVAVVEVGMGGRLDSTNVLKPVVSCITSIDYDHTEYLGKTLSKIAFEKAGIIKPGVPVVCGRMSSSAKKAIARVASQNNCQDYWLDRDASGRVVSLGIEGSKFEYHGLEKDLKLSTNLAGLHQIDNASLAVLALEVATRQGLSISRSAIEKGVRNARWPGRLEVINQNPFIVVDAAHNISGVKALVETLRRLDFKPDIILFGVLRDKDFRKMIKLLASLTKRFVFTKPNSPRALPLRKLAEAANQIGLTYLTTSSVDKAVSQACSAASTDGRIMVCGSIYLIGDVMRVLGNDPCETRIC